MFATMVGDIFESPRGMHRIITSVYSKELAHGNKQPWRYQFSFEYSADTDVEKKPDALLNG